jgi:hypothetical protein
MLFTQPKARPSIGTTRDPLSPGAFAPYPQHSSPSQKHRVAHQGHSLSTTSFQPVPTHEYAGSCLRLFVPVYTTYEAGQRRMMRAGKEHASSGPATTRHFEFTIALQTTDTSSNCTFQTSPLPDMGLTFLPRPQPRPRKRSRPAADIDGEHSCMQKKKRRLRLFLITSRLSPQFSHPATNIVDRGSSKIAVWAKQQASGRNLLRKAAILNHIRRRAVAAKESGGGCGQVLIEQEKEQRELALAKLEFNHGSVDTYTRPVTLRNPSVPPAAAVRTGGRFVMSGSPTGSPTSSRSPSPTPTHERSEEPASDYRSPNEAYAYSLSPAQTPRRDYLPLPPSPLGLSNYDAFDADENVSDPYSCFDDEDEDLSIHFFNEEEDADNVPFSPSAVTATSSSTMQTSVSQVLKTPQNVQSDLNVLDHGEPVFGDYDQVEDGADAIWPCVPPKEVDAATTGSTSPDFNALFATAPAKRTDSFATSPNFRPTIPRASASQMNPLSASISPNFAPTSLPTCRSPRITPSTTSSSAIPAFAAPCTSPNLVATAISPNFLAIDVPSVPGYPPSQRRMSIPTEELLDDPTRPNVDAAQGRKGGKHSGSVPFGS